MVIDAMEIDSNPVSAGQAESEKERKRKHKHKDESSSSKKKRKHEKDGSDKKDKKEKKEKKDKSSKSKDKSSKSDPTTTPKKARPSSATTSSVPDSPYSLTTATLYLPLSPISISPTHALASLLAEHLSPLLLTYYPPFQGIILAYSNASISSEPPSSQSTTSTSPNPQPLTLAATAGEYGVMYVYLTATFLVFRPQRGQTLEGWVNVQSEGFLGAVVLNLFSVGIERKRLSPSWKWIPPGEEDESGESQPATAPTSEDEDDETKPPFDPEKEHFNPVPLVSESNPFSFDIDTNVNQTGDQDSTNPEITQNQDADADADHLEGHFQSVSGHKVSGTIKFRVVDVDVIPGTERDRGFLSIEGTMLSPDDEARVLEDERNGNVAPSSTLPIRKMTVPMASGGLVVTDDVHLDTPSKKGKGRA